MICDGRGCSVIAHLNCYFSERSQDANDTISDMEHWHCENCGGLPRHMHPRPRAAKRARVSFGPDLAGTLITKGGFATGLQGGGWGGHWPPRTERPQLTTGKGKEAMEQPITHIDYDRGALAALPSRQPDHTVAVTTTACHFCRRTDSWPYLTCGVCQLTTHATCYYRLGSDESAYYQTHPSDWRCQDCSGPQRHTDCVISNDEQMLQRLGHDGPRLPISGYHGSEGEGGASGAPTRLRTDGVISHHGQFAGLGHPSGAPNLSAGGGGADDPGPSRHRSILRRDKESMDCDLPESSNTELSTPLRHIMTIGDGSSVLADAMLVDQDERNPAMPLSSADCPVPIDQPPRNKRCPKAKKPKKLYPKRQGGDHRREFQGQGWQSRGPPPSDSSL